MKTLVLTFAATIAVTVALGTVTFAEDSVTGSNPKPQSPADSRSPTDTRYILVMGPNRPWVAELNITVEGRPHREHWERWLEERFDLVDANDNGRLEGDEIGRIVRQNGSTTPNSLLRALGFRNPAGRVTGDSDGDGVVTLEELATFRRSQRRGEFRVETEAVPGASELGERTRSIIDADSVEGMSRAELLDAVRTLSRLDRNEDELLTASEVVSTNPGGIVFSVNANEQIPATPNDVVDVPTDDHARLFLARRLVAKYRPEGVTEPGLSRGELRWWGPVDLFEKYDADGNGRLNERELVTFLGDPVCDLRLTVAFHTKKWWRNLPLSASQWNVEGLTGTQKHPVRVYRTGGRRFRVVIGGDSIEFLPPRTLEGTERSLMANFKSQFGNADSDNNAYLDRQECSRYFYFNGLFEELDADADGKVYEPELDAFLKRELVSARSRTRLIVADRGRNHFDLLDGNRNGTITPRELVSGVDRIMAKDADRDGRVVTDEVPRFLRITVQPGMPEFKNSRFAIGTSSMTSYGGGRYQNAGKAPAWFRGMDRNRDGDVSAREFLGAIADFERLDTDGDELLSVQEARAASGEQTKSTQSRE